LALSLLRIHRRERKAPKNNAVYIQYRKSRTLLHAFVAVWLAGATLCQAQVTLTVTPPVVSNTYTGLITLNITGLTNGQQVTVQTFLDLNGNGVVDPGEPMLDAFKITDGKAMIIGGVTNVSVPFDSNPAPGAITTTLSFAPPLENIVGQKIYRVVSTPPGAFPPARALLNVTNAPLGQSVTGLVSSNGVAPLPNAVVVALTPTDQKYVGSTVADGTGHYLLTLPVGAYLLLPALPGYYTDQNLSPTVTLTTGASSTNNLTLTNGTVAISGQVYDSVSSNALMGVFLQAQSGSLFGVTFTDTNGNYTAAANTNNWKMKLTSDRLGRRAYLAPQGNALTVNATLGSVTNANMALYKGNALFYGQLTISGVPVPNFPIEANDNNQILSSKSFTDLNGNYGVAALMDTNVLGTSNASWYCSANPSDASAPGLTNYIYSSSTNVTLATNQAMLQNFIGLPITATISGRLVNNSGVAVSHVGVGAGATIAGNQFTAAYVDTDANGNFSFGAASGQWYLNANCCGSDGLSNAGYFDPASFHLVTIPPTNAVMNIVVYPVGSPVLTQPEWLGPGEFGFNLSGSAGNNYAVQATTNLGSTNWTTITTVSNLSGNGIFIIDFGATTPLRFYRAVQLP
jgi:hypothetical protein